MTMFRKAKQTPHDYASAVVNILRPHFDDLAEPLTQDIVRDAITRHAATPSDTFEVIIDNPTLANWRLKPGSPPGRVRLSCYRLTRTEQDQQRVDQINSALAAVGAI